MLPCICLFTAPSARYLTWLTAASSKLLPFVCLISWPACACGAHPAMTSLAGFHGGAMVLLLQMLLLLLPVYTLLRLTGRASAVAHAAPRRIKALYPDIRRGHRDGWTCFCVGGWRQWRLGLLFVLVLFFHLVRFAWSKLSCKVTRRQTFRKRRRWPSARVNYDCLLGWWIKSWRNLTRVVVFSLSVKSPLNSTEAHFCHPRQKIRAQYHIITWKLTQNMIVSCFLCENYQVKTWWNCESLFL